MAGNHPRPPLHRLIPISGTPHPPQASSQFHHETTTEQMDVSPTYERLTLRAGGSTSGSTIGEPRVFLSRPYLGSVCWNMSGPARSIAVLPALEKFTIYGKAGCGQKPPMKTRSNTGPCTNTQCFTGHIGSDPCDKSHRLLAQKKEEILKGKRAKGPLHLAM